MNSRDRRRFQGRIMLVLIGDVPENAGAETIQSLKQAIDAGVRVWIQAPVRIDRPSHGLRRWGSKLSPLPVAIDRAVSISLWLDLYQLGREIDESAARWKALTPTTGTERNCHAGNRTLNG